MSTTYKGTNKLITGIVFGVLTFWLFAQAMVNVVPAVLEDLGISPGTLNIAISLTALFSGIFIVNAVAGTLVVANTYVQEGRGFTSFQSGMLSIGYLIAVLAMIRVGEKILQKIGAKKPMIWGTVLTLIGVGVMGLTFLSDVMYTIIVFIGFALFGLGLGIYATPSTDTAVANAPSEKIGAASGIYKMASSLGSAFGVAISATVYAMIADNSVHTATTAGIITNVIFAAIALLSIIFMVPNNAGKDDLKKMS